MYVAKRYVYISHNRLHPHLVNVMGLSHSVEDAQQKSRPKVFWCFKSSLFGHDEHLNVSFTKYSSRD